MPDNKPKTIPYWPYCETCQTPYRFDPDEPFAYCDCPDKTVEWADQRPAPYVKDPNVS